MPINPPVEGPKHFYIPIPPPTRKEHDELCERVERLQRELRELRRRVDAGKET